jgi:hypothetical protein
MLVLELPFSTVVRLWLTANAGAATTRPPVHVARRPRATSVSNTSAYGRVPSPRKLPRRFPDAGDDLTGRKSAGRQPSSASSVLKEEKDLARQLD